MTVLRLEEELTLFRRMRTKEVVEIRRNVYRQRLIPLLMQLEVARENFTVRLLIKRF